MNKQSTFILILSLMVLLPAMCGSASAAVVTFDDITTEPLDMLPIPDDYSGFHWDNFYILDAIDYDTPSGYRNGLVSGEYVAWSTGQSSDISDVLITITVGDSFDFTGSYMTAAWRDDLNVTVEGLRDDVLLYSQTVVVDPYDPTWFEFNFININQLRFSSDGGTPSYGSGHHFVMDNFTFVLKPATTYYVDAVNGNDDNDGLSPEMAFATIQKGIDSANDGDTIIVQPDLYYENINFNGKNITLRSTDPNDPNVVRNTIIDGNQNGSVVTFSGTESPACVLSGFTITNGFADPVAGGIYGNGTSATIQYNNIVDNMAVPGGFPGVAFGGGLYDCDGIIQYNIISDNIAFAPDWECFSVGGGLYDCDGTIQYNIISKNEALGFNKERTRGGGLHGCDGTIQDNTISGNSADGDGGGLDYCSANIRNNVISYNSALHGSGGGLHECSGEIENNTIRSNSASLSGGGLYVCSGNISNCIISGNTAIMGGGLYSFDGAISNCTFIGNRAERESAGVMLGGDPITNCIFRDNVVEGDSPLCGSTQLCTSAIYSCIQDWPYGGEGNIDADPCFVSPGYWADVNDTNIIVEPDDPNAIWIDGDYHLLRTSPCIDAGDNSVVTADTDLDGNPRIFDGNDDGNSVVDMGAYEFVPPLEVAMKFTPQALNLRSKGKWVKAHFVLPEGFLPEDVDTNTPAVIEPLGIESKYMNVFINEDDLVEIEAVFSRADFCASPITDDATEVTVTGLLTTGQRFYGTDTIKIINKSLEYLAAFASYWLQTNCGEPHWCDGLDVNQDSVINFIDFAMFDSCCFEVIKQ